MAFSAATVAMLVQHNKVSTSVSVEINVLLRFVWAEHAPGLGLNRMSGCWSPFIEVVMVHVPALWFPLSHLDRGPGHHFARAPGEDPGLGDHLQHAGLPCTLVPNHHHLTTHPTAAH